MGPGGVARACFLGWCDQPVVPGEEVCAEHGRLEWSAACADFEGCEDRPVGARFPPAPHAPGRQPIRRDGRDVLVTRCWLGPHGLLHGSVEWRRIEPPRDDVEAAERVLATLRRLRDGVCGMEAGGGRNHELAKVAFVVGGLAGAGRLGMAEARVWLRDLAIHVCPDERVKAIETVKRQFKAGTERPLAA